MTALCSCGCGQPTPVASKTDKRRGHVKGLPLAFIHGHNRRDPSLGIVERFWSYVEKTDSCWNWTGASHPNGYGLLQGPDRRHIRATHLSLELAGTPVPDGLCALHRCDNPRCVRPDHLFIGTKADNTADMMAKGRHVSGFAKRGAA